MYFNELSSLVILLITVEVSIARTLHRRFDISEFLTPSSDQNEEVKSNQAKTSAATQESDFEYDGLRGIIKQTKDYSTVATNQIATASANIGVAGGGIMANVGYQLLNIVQRSIKWVGGETVEGLEKVQNKHKSISTMARDALSGTGNFIVGKLERFSGILDDVAKMSGEQEVEENHHRHRHAPEIQSEFAVEQGSEFQQEHKKNKKKKITATEDGKKKKKKGRNLTHRETENGKKKKKKDPKEVTDEEKKKKKKKDPKELTDEEKKKKKKDPKEINGEEKKKKKKKRTEKVVVDEDLIVDE